MRNFQKIADEIIKVIEEECDFDEGRIESILDQIDIVKRSNYYKAPELEYMSWDELQSILSKYFVPSNSKWETKIMIIFNDLKGSIEDYWNEVS